MDKLEEEAVLRITAEYVAEVQAGHAPHFSDYLARYPQYADAIAEFVTYYHALEVDLPGESLVIPQLSEGSSTALGRAWERIQEPSSDRAVSAGPLTLLLAHTSRRQLTLAELAVKSGLSQDIAEKLERRVIAASTLPQELLQRFAALFQQPLSVIAACFGFSGQQTGEPIKVVASLGDTRIAEARSLYQIEGQPGVQAQSFREALEQSVQLSDEQKAAWRDILSSEGL